jgi:hypothetical protein
MTDGAVKERFRLLNTKARNTRPMSNPIETIGILHREVSDRYDVGYRAWLDKLTTLSVGALTLLVSLQNTYVPRNPRASVSPHY